MTGNIVWEIDKILNNPLSRITMFFNDGEGFNIDNKSIACCMIDETFKIGASCNYQQSVETNILSRAPFGELIVDAIAKFGYSSKIIQQTIKQWEGTEAPVFSIGVLFVATKPTDKVQEKAKCILARTMTNVDGNYIMQAPMGYSVKNALTSTGSGYLSAVEQPNSGLCTLSIGNWFQASGLLLTGADFDFSTACIKNGSPLYATGNVSFAPYRDLGYQDFLKFFLTTD